MTANKPQVTAVIVSYQSRQTVAAGLNALHGAHATGFANVVVVDNASNDGTADFVAKCYPWVTLVRSAENLGYGRALNLGMEQVTTPYVLLMNPDVVLPGIAVRKLVDFMETHPRAAMSAPAIIEDGGSIQLAGVLPTPWHMIVTATGLRSARQRPINPGGAPFQSDWLCGAILMTRLKSMNAIGGFDPRYFLYFEETDLCRRVIAHGGELWAVGEAVARHAGSDSAKRTNERLYKSCIAEHYFQSRFYYMAKFFGWPLAAAAELLEYSLLALRVFCRIGTGKRPDATVLDRLRAPLLRLPRKVCMHDPWTSANPIRRTDTALT
jgi:N-acetylglucosaminyl-diphospho-decaprenol L-rhamnosyltransferase